MGGDDYRKAVMTALAVPGRRAVESGHSQVDGDNETIFISFHSPKFDLSDAPASGGAAILPANLPRPHPCGIYAECTIDEKGIPSACRVLSAENAYPIYATTALAWLSGSAARYAPFPAAVIGKRRPGSPSTTQHRKSGMPATPRRPRRSAEATRRPVDLPTHTLPRSSSVATR